MGQVYMLFLKILVQRQVLADKKRFTVVKTEHRSATALPTQAVHLETVLVRNGSRLQPCRVSSQLLGNTRRIVRDTIQVIHLLIIQEAEFNRHIFKAYVQILTGFSKEIHRFFHRTVALSHICTFDMSTACACSVYPPFTVRDTLPK